MPLRCGEIYKRGSQPLLFYPPASTEPIEGPFVEIAQTIDHAPTASAARRERGVLQKFGTTLDCYSAIAVHDTGDAIHAFMGELEGDRAVRVSGATIDDVYAALTQSQLPGSDPRF